MAWSNATARLCNRCDGKLWDDERETCRRCKGDKHPQDTFIRRAGFRIHARPRRGTSLWELGGKLYDYTDAMDLAQRRLGIVAYMA